MACRACAAPAAQATLVHVRSLGSDGGVGEGMHERDGRGVPGSGAEPRRGLGQSPSGVRGGAPRRKFSQFQALLSTKMGSKLTLLPATQPRSGAALLCFSSALLLLSGYCCGLGRSVHMPAALLARFALVRRLLALRTINHVVLCIITTRARCFALHPARKRNAPPRSGGLC